MDRFDLCLTTTRWAAYNTIVLPQLATPTNRIDTIAGPSRDHHLNPSRIFVQQPPSHTTTKKHVAQHAREKIHGARDLIVVNISCGSARIRNGIIFSVLTLSFTSKGHCASGAIERLISNIDLFFFPTTSVILSVFDFHAATSMRSVMSNKLFSFSALMGDSPNTRVK